MARVSPPSLTGHQIGGWSVGASFKHALHGYRMYTCVCACGNEKAVKHAHLANGKTSSCGCSWTTHGMSRSNEYQVWDSMIRRCHNSNHHAFKDYGARGIQVCDKWRTFEGFFDDMGNQPKGMTLERKDNSAGYSKDNCKWATVTEQARNRRSTKLSESKVVEIKRMLENRVSQSAIAEQFGVTRSAIGHISCGATWRN